MEKEKATEKKDVRDSWDKYTCGSFLKADDITSPDDPYVCIDLRPFRTHVFSVNHCLRKYNIDFYQLPYPEERLPQ